MTCLFKKMKLSGLPRGIVTLSQTRYFASKPKPKTGVVMMNMGGPAEPKQTRDFLTRLFTDPEIIPMGGGKLQKKLAQLIVDRRGPKVEKQYEKIGGSPIRKWTDWQGTETCKILNERMPNAAPFKHYTCFRYAPPLTQHVLEQMRMDGVEHAIAFSQYPQWCCNTSGSSLNHLWRELERLKMTDAFQWSIIDRWYLHPSYIDAIVDRIQSSLQTIPTSDNSDVLILFSAHSIPMKTIAKGDPYVFEVSATVKAIMARLQQSQQCNHKIYHQLSWQSKVGFLPWMAPSTEHVLKSIGKQKRMHSNVLVVPFVFTSDHIETLYELDIEYAEIAEKAGIHNYIRVPALNDSPLFIQSLADIVCSHLESEQNIANESDYLLRCHDCTNERCRTIINPRY